VTSLLRADARRNLDRILDAAAEVFAELGPDATIDEIARRAGVGHGTVFRRFPTKDALRAAVLAARLEEMHAYADELLERPDAGAAFDEFVMYAAQCCRRDRAFFEGIERCGEQFPDVVRGKLELRDAVNKLIRRARREGHVRRDLDARDVGALVGAAIEASMYAERPEAWRRYVRILLDGLRS
jgi:AcrR family transcriptional regulator